MQLTTDTRSSAVPMTLPVYRAGGRVEASMGVSKLVACVSLV